jgi:hypothetical protein
VAPAPGHRQLADGRQGAAFETGRPAGIQPIAPRLFWAIRTGGDVLEDGGIWGPACGYRHVRVETDSARAPHLARGVRGRGPRAAGQVRRTAAGTRWRAWR